jgi:Uma2 family endonuclease
VAFSILHKKHFHIDKETGKVYFTYSDLKKLPEWPESPLLELFNGELFMVPSRSLQHQEISDNLMIIIKQYLREHNLGKVWSSPVDVVLSEENVVIPDIVFLSKDSLDILTKQEIRGVPNFIIEILSTNRKRDLEDKKLLYEKFGVEEYWIIDPVNQDIIVFDHNGNWFEERNRYILNNIIEVKSIHGLKVKESDVFNF